MKNSRNTQKILLDTSFLLPTLGFEVEPEVTRALSKIGGKSYQLFYSDLSLLECSWIVARQIKRGNYPGPIFRLRLLSITKSQAYERVIMSHEDYLTALEFFQEGHTDMIDNLLYAVALRNQFQFLTIDNELSRFITEKKIENIILTPRNIL